MAGMGRGQRQRGIDRPQSVVQKARGLFLGVSHAAQRRAHHRAHAIAVLVGQIELAVFEGQHRTHHGELTEPIESLHALGIDPFGGVEVVDLRSIRPLDEEAILNSVKKTGRALLVEENKPYCGVDAQISHLIQLKAFDYLDAPVHRVSSIDAPTIYAKPLEDWQIPNEERIIAMAMKLMA